MRSVMGIGIDRIVMVLATIAEGILMLELREEGTVSLLLVLEVLRRMVREALEGESRWKVVDKRLREGKGVGSQR